MRISLPEDYVAAGLPPPEDYAKGAIHKCPVCECLGLEFTEDMEVTELKQGDIADEAYQAWQAHEEELFFQNEMLGRGPESPGTEEVGGGDLAVGIEEKEKRGGRGQEMGSLPEN